MSEQRLSGEELDTLLDGVEKGEVEIEEGAAPEADVRVFDFDDQYNVLIGRMSRLAKVHENLVKELTASIGDLVGREPSVQVAYVNACRFGECASRLAPPLALHLVQVNPEHRTALFALDAALAYIMVDQYFGGGGNLKGKQSSLALSPTETRMSKQIASVLARDLGRAWHGAHDFTFTLTEALAHPDDIRVFRAAEIVFEVALQIGFEDTFGEARVILPYSLIEQIRDDLLGEAGSDDDVADSLWQSALARQVNTATVSLSGTIEGVRMNLKRLVELAPGDVIAINMPELISVNVEGVPAFRAMFGAANGHHAVKIVETRYREEDFEENK